MTADKNVAKLLAAEIMGEDYRESTDSKLTSLLRRAKKCLHGLWQSLFGFVLGH